MHIRAAFEEGACGAIAFAWTDEWWRGGHPTSTTGRSGWSIANAASSRRRSPSPRRSTDAPFPRERAAHVAARLGRRLRLQRRRHARRLPVVARAADLSRLRDHPRQRRLDGSDGRDRPRASARARDRHRRTAGLSAARNVGLAEATGEIVAYTDADTRVDRDWLTFLVQPFLTSDVVGSGGPNVVPADDPPMAQCIARAPGGPTHVLLDDRIAEHVPGCNMAFRRDALARDRRLQPDLPARRRRRGRVLAAAGARLEDRLRVGGARLASPPRVGEGLLAAAGRLRRRRDVADGAPSGEVPRRPHAVARPHLQPAAVRALALGHAHQRRRLGHGGVSVGLPHRRAPVRVPAALDQVAGDLVRARWSIGAGVAVDRRCTDGPRRCCSAAGWSALPRRSPRTSPTRCGPTWTRCRAAELWYRAMVAYLHFIQPLARLRGRIRGVLSPPEVALPPAQRADQPRSAAVARRSVARAAAHLGQRHRGSLLERDVDDRPIACSTQLTDWLRRSRAVRHDRDRRGLVRRSRRERLRRPLGVARRARARRRARRRQVAAARQHAPAADHLRRRRRALALGVALLVGARCAASRCAGRSPARRRAGLAVAAHRRRRVADRAGHRHRAARHRAGRPSAPAWSDAVRAGARAAHRAVAAAHVRPAQRHHLRRHDPGARRRHVHAARGGDGAGDRRRSRGSPATTDRRSRPGSTRRAASSSRRTATSTSPTRTTTSSGGSTPRNGVITTVVGNHELGPGFSRRQRAGDRRAARHAGRRGASRRTATSSSPTRTTIASAASTAPTGVITTIAGSGENGYDGDDRPATEAALNTPSAVAAAPNGDIYIADTLNYRVRMIDAKTG